MTSTRVGPTDGTTTSAQDAAPTGPSASTIVFDAVTKRYPGGAPGARPAVEAFSAELRPGAITVLLGSSGCGKTTLLRMVNRMVEPTSGRVLIDGEDVTRGDAVALRRSIGYVMQNGGLLPHRRVIDNIALVPRLSGASRADAHDRARELMELVGLDASLARRYPHQLSGGQAQRVGVARALAADPGVLLMDEPFGAVDPLVRRELQHELWRLQGELAKTVLFVTHDVDEALALGDDIILLREGAEIAQRGTGPELLEHPADDFVIRFLGLDDAARARRLREVADATDAVASRGGGTTNAAGPADGHPAGAESA